MRHRLFIPLLALAACSSEPNHLGNPLWWPAVGIANAAENAAYQRRRGRVEVLVKSNHPGIVDEIRAGQGTALASAMDEARIPSADRPARLIQLQGDAALYRANPGALVTALMVYGR